MRDFELIELADDELTEVAGGKGCAIDPLGNSPEPSVDPLGRGPSVDPAGG